MAAPAPSLTATSLESRLQAFQALVNEAGMNSPGQVPANYVQRVEAALRTVEAQSQVDTRALSATWVSRGFLRGGDYKDPAGNVVSADLFKAAKELVPADAMVRSTLRGVLERHRDAERQLGRRPAAWEAELEAHRTKADAALTRLRGGDKSAAAELGTELAAIRDALRAVTAEIATDEAALTGMRNGVNTFEPVANDTGIFSRRREEKASIELGRRVVESLAGEPGEERRIAGRGDQMVRPLVIGRLQHDPSMADRNYPTVTAQIGAWDTVRASATETSSRASSLDRTVASFQSALTTVAEGPATLQRLDGALGQARGAAEEATRALQQARQQHANTARGLQVSHATAQTALAISIGNVREARSATDAFAQQAEEQASLANSLGSQIRDQEREIRDAEENNRNNTGNSLPGGSTGNALPGGGNRLPGSGGNALPGGSTGNSLPGGSAPPRIDIGPMRRRLSDLQSRQSDAVARNATARQHYDEAANALRRAEFAAAAASAAVAGIVEQMRGNDAFLAGYASAQERASAAYEEADRAKNDAQSAIQQAGQTVASATQTITAAANAYNASVTAMSPVVGNAVVGDDGKKALGEIPAQPFSVPMIAGAVQAGTRGADAMRQATSTFAQAADRRVRLASESGTRLRSQADEIVNRAVRETLGSN